MRRNKFGAKFIEVSFHGERWIVLGHKISCDGIEVDKAKLDTIEKLPPFVSTKDIQSFLGYVGFYRWFIKDFSKISKPMTKLFDKDTLFNFDQEYLKAFLLLKQRLIQAPIMKALSCNYPFELMCDASD